LATVQARPLSLLQLKAEAGSRGAPVPPQRRMTLLSDMETSPETSSMKVPFFQSAYLECRDDSDCCPNSNCKWPAKAVRGTTDHKTCIMRVTGIGLLSEAYCKPCIPIEAHYRNGKCDPKTAPKKKKKRSESGELSEESGTGSNLFEPDDDDEAAVAKPKQRLPEADVIGEAPHSDLDSDQVDDIARFVIQQRLQRKCDGVEEWCPDQLVPPVPAPPKRSSLDSILSPEEVKEIKRLEKIMS